MSKKYIEIIHEARDKLNTVGNGFCLAKWNMETLYLHMGDNHSCYHPRPHKIDKNLLKANPSALHNTPWKKEVRKQMMEGKRPEECYYCWNIEDLEGNHISDRMKHSSNYIDNTFDDIVKGGWEQDWNPRHLEVSFGNGCNFRCGYCCPQASSSWMEEIKRHGNYDLTYNQYGIEFLGNSDFFNKDDPNPYVDAFWEWWPVLKKDLRVFRITGGEPLMNPNTFKLLKMLEDEPEPNLEIHVNSNLGVTHRLVQKLVDHVKVLLEKKAIKGFKLYTSIDTWGPQAEYIRTNLDLNLWEQNLRYYLDNLPRQDISFMVTFNVLTVANFRSLLEKILELRKIYPGNEWHQRVQFDTPYLKEPPHWMINILPDSFNIYMESHLQFIADNLRKNNQVGFNEIEYEVFKRVVDYMKQNPVDAEKIKKGRRDFYVFFNETDNRNGTDFYKTFPEYIDFMALCKQEFLSYENPKD